MNNKVMSLFFKESRLVCRNLFLVYMSLMILKLTASQGEGLIEASHFFRNDYTYVKETGLFYKCHRKEQTWPEAVKTCAHEGAQLAVPKTVNEAVILVKKFLPRTYEVWLGLHDIFIEGEFFSIDGRPAGEYFTYWSLDEPNNSGRGEDCVTMDKEVEYSDVSCDQLYRFICTKKSGTFTFNTQCESYDSEYFYSAQRDRCYKFHSEANTWTNAFKVCQAEQSSMVIINSADEADMLAQILDQYPEDELTGNFNRKQVHVDFSEIVFPGVIQTSDGLSLEEAGYSDWSPDQVNKLSSESCGSMQRDGKLRSIGCDVKAMYFCEKKLVRKLESIQLLERFGHEN